MIDVAPLLADGAWTLAQSQQVHDHAQRLEVETRNLLLTYRLHRLRPLSGASGGVVSVGMLRRLLQSTCGHCSDPIESDDVVVGFDDDLIHVRCWRVDEMQQRRLAQKVPRRLAPQTPSAGVPTSVRPKTAMRAGGKGLAPQTRKVEGA